jgi:hypothetical protein
LVRREPKGGGPCGTGSLGVLQMKLFGNTFLEDKCRCLEATIFHELIHNAGINHTDPLNLGDPKDPVNLTEARCFSCSSFHR